MRDLFAAEFLKLRTTKTPWALLAGSAAISALAVAGAVAAAADNPSVDLASTHDARLILNVSINGSIFMLTLGIIIAAGEYRHRTAADTFLTTPHRWRVVLAKLMVSGTVGLGFGAVSSITATGAEILMLNRYGYSLNVTAGEIWSVLAGSVVYAALFGTIGAATGSLLRNQVAGIVGWLAWLFVIEHSMRQLAPGVGKWFPAAAGRALVGNPNEVLLAPVVGAIVVAVYCGALASSAVYLEGRRDA